MIDIIEFMLGQIHKYIYVTEYTSGKYILVY